MQIVVLQKHCRGCLGGAAITRKAGGIGQSGRACRGLGHQRAIGDGVSGDRGMAATGKRRDLVEKAFGPGDHACAAHRIVAAGLRRIAHGVGAIERVIEAAPARVGGIERIASIHHRDHQLRAGDTGNLGIDALGFDLEVGALGKQVADLLQESGIGCGIVGLAATRLVPAVDHRLQGISLVEQDPISRPEFMDQRGQPRPEGVGGDAGARQRFALDHVVQRAGDLQAVDVDAVGHGMNLGKKTVGVKGDTDLEAVDSESMQSLTINRWQLRR